MERLAPGLAQPREADITRLGVKCLKRGRWGRGRPRRNNFTTKAQRTWSSGIPKKNNPKLRILCVLVVNNFLRALAPSSKPSLLPDFSSRRHLREEI
jgi:hypothetical protein